MRRSSVVIALAALAAILTQAGCGGDESTTTSTAASAPAHHISPADLGHCRDALSAPGFRCGHIQVPFERTEPSLGDTRIAFAVRARDDRDRPPLGTIFAVEGGPGYASTGSATTYVKLFGSLLRHRDLVLVDERGTGGSDALNCPDLQKGRAPDWIALSDCAEKLGPIAGSYRTAAAADDINDVRATLGVDDIDLYGDSYGTFLAQSYAFRHGDTLRSLVLDSAYPDRGESAWYPSLPRVGVRALGIVCRRSPECSGNAERRLDRAVHELRKTQRGVGPLIDTIINGAFDPPDHYLRVNRAIRELVRGNSAPFDKLTYIGREGYGRLHEYSHAQELFVSCNDYPMLWDKRASEAERRKQLEQTVADHPKHTFDPFTPREIALSSTIGYLYCLTFPPPNEFYEPPVARGAKAPDIPVLVLSGELDDVTTPHEGALAADEFPDSRHFVVRNVGHVASLYDYSGPAARRIRAFLRRNG